jgi:flavin-dependent dehydrogenase
MQYDLIVVGGGPAGLMAAKTAAEDGLKVVLIERKRDICEVNRACLQTLYVQKISPLEGGKTYKEQVTVEVRDEFCRFHFHVPGFTLDYRGPLRPYLNWIQISPAGYQVHRFKPNDRIWGFHYSKEAFLTGLLESVEKAGVRVLRESAGVGAENAKGRVRIFMRGERSRAVKTLEAGNAVVAEGIISRIVQSLGLERSRQAISSALVKGVWYLLEGLTADVPGSSLITYTIPSIYTRNVIIAMMGQDRNSITAGVVPYQRLAAHPTLAPLLRNARVVKRMSFSNFVRAPLREPVVGNIVIAGDSAAPTETWVQGAVACGYQAVKAIEKERNGEQGYQGYINWWQNAFSFNNPTYFSTLSAGYILNRVCTDDEVDYVYNLLKDSVGIPAVLVWENLDVIKDERPGLYQKLMKSREQTMWQSEKRRGDTGMG